MSKESLSDVVRRLTKDVPDHHGFLHVDSVATWSVVLAFFEEGKIGAASASGLLHDLRKKDDEELAVRKIEVGWNVPGEINIKEIYRKHRDEVLEGETDFWKAFEIHRDALVALRVIAVSKDEKKNDEKLAPAIRTSRAERLMTKIVGDGDKLSRAGILGLTSILEANQDYKVPFYEDGEEIVRSDNASIIKFNEITSCIKDINSCTGDWEKMMETKEGKALMPTLDRTSHKFLEIFKEHTDILDYNVWLGWLRSIVDSQTSERAMAQSLFESGKYAEFLQKTIELEDPNLVSEEKLQDFLRPMNQMI